jgi:hydrogenase/urease accessory protein HupE
VITGIGLLFSSTAEAHLVTTGLGPVYDGISHLLLTPEDLLPVLALTLFAGLRGASYSRLTLFVVPTAWLLGGIIGLLMGWPANPAMAAFSLLALGGLVAADVRLPQGALIGIACIFGLFHGFLNGAAMEEARLGALGLLGIVSTLFVLIALIASFVVPLRIPWMRIAVRVLGSWIVAIGLLMLGWAFGGQA